ncbi:MAG TPA: DUF4350 domain-containing protein, partial [Chitinophagaceae bacterium]|nr:DUF4350 domain-containing protein [Chitinophagaceae bacterium]
MRKSVAYIFLLFSLLTGCRQGIERPLPSLNETYRKEDKKPFGSYVAYNHIKALFDYKYIEVNTDPFNSAWYNTRHYSTNTQYSLYFLITKNIEVSDQEADAMVDYVEAGNDLFIAADYIDPRLLERIKCETERLDEIISEVHGKMKETSVRMPARLRHSGGPARLRHSGEPAPLNHSGGDFGEDFKAPVYTYYYYPFQNYFSGSDSINARVLGVNEAGKPNYIVIFLGKGRLYLHAAPRAFSNYFLLTGNNFYYLENVLSYLRFEPKNIYWDEYYKNQSVGRSKKTAGSGRGSNDDDKEKFSPFNVIKQNPPLLWAFWLAVIVLLLYVLVNIKRKQRVIDEIKPNTNTTVTFTETVGRLYLQKKNNNNIAEKMITYFYEHIRNSYFLNTAQVNNEFMNSLARKSG